MQTNLEAQPATIAELLAPHDAGSPAIRAVDGGTMTYGQLRQQVAATRAALNAYGIGPGDCVAMVLENGPHMAAAFTSVSAAGRQRPRCTQASAPREFRESLASLRAKALMVDDADRALAVAAAKEAGIPVIRLQPTTSSGGFRLASDPSRHRLGGGNPTPRDTRAAAAHLGYNRPTEACSAFARQPRCVR